jgi:hypothetical protein
LGVGPIKALALDRRETGIEIVERSAAVRLVER